MRRVQKLTKNVSAQVRALVNRQAQAWEKREHSTQRSYRPWALFNLIKSIAPMLRYEPGTVVAEETS